MSNLNIEFRFHLSLFLTVFAITTSGLQAEESEAGTASSPAASRLLESVKYLADDELEGRAIGTEEIAEAGEYLVSEFKKMGLQTDVFSGSPYQEFSIRPRSEMGPEENNNMAFVQQDGDDKESDRMELELEDDYTPLAIGGSGEFTNGLAFVGYGITSDDLEYDDYAGIDVKDKAVVILRKEPQQNDESSKFDGSRNTAYATFRRKIQTAVENGAAAVIFVNDSLTPETQKKSLVSVARRIGRRLDTSLEEIREMEKRDGDEFTQKLEAMAAQVKELREYHDQMNDDDYDPMPGFAGAGARTDAEIPVFFASRKKINRLMRVALGQSLLEIEKAIDEDLKPRSALLENWRAEGEAKVVQVRTKVRNVVAVLDGEGDLADQTIVIGAHYDHVGKGGPGSLAPWTVAVHNGADDNASGTSTLLEVARRFAGRDKKPKRRMVFIGFTGEESGLLGSAHYVQNPRFPIEDTIAMVNLDMVGRLRDNNLMIEGTGTADEFDKLVDDLNEGYDFDITKKPSGFGPSDHASFYRGKVPVLFLFTGLHSDYHRPGDDWQKINFDGMAKITDYAVDMIDALDSNEKRPTYRSDSGGRRRNRLILGVIPDNNAEEEGGLVIRQLSEGGPAEKAGVLAGDVVTSLGGEEIKNVIDLRRAIRQQTADKPVELKVIRDGEEKKLEVTLQRG